MNLDMLKMVAAEILFIYHLVNQRLAVDFLWLQQGFFIDLYLQDA